MHTSVLQGLDSLKRVGDRLDAHQVGVDEGHHRVATNHRDQHRHPHHANGVVPEAPGADADAHEPWSVEQVKVRKNVVAHQGVLVPGGVGLAAESGEVQHVAVRFVLHHVVHKLLRFVHELERRVLAGMGRSFSATWGKAVSSDLPPMALLCVLPAKDCPRPGQRSAAGGSSWSPGSQANVGTSPCPTPLLQTRLSKKDKLARNMSLFALSH